MSWTRAGQRKINDGTFLVFLSYSLSCFNLLHNDLELSEHSEAQNRVSINPSKTKGTLQISTPVNYALYVETFSIFVLCVFYNSHILLCLFLSFCVFPS